MKKRYFFIGDSHASYLIRPEVAPTGSAYAYVVNEIDEAVSFYMSSTMWSFPKSIDYYLSVVINDFSRFASVGFIFGTNDVMKKVSQEDPLSVSVDRYLDKVSELLEKLHLPRPIVLSPTPSTNPHIEPKWRDYSDRYHAFEYIKERFKKVDALLSQGCRSRGLDFLSMYDLLELEGALDPKYSLDGIHFNSLGKDLYLDRLVAYTYQ